MKQQEEIREDAIVITKNQLWEEGIRDEQRLAVRAIQIVDQIFSRQNEKGVVIKVDRELPHDFPSEAGVQFENLVQKNMLKAGWEATIPLVGK